MFSSKRQTIKNINYVRLPKCITWWKKTRLYYEM